MLGGRRMASARWVEFPWLVFLIFSVTYGGMAYDYNAEKSVVMLWSTRETGWIKIGVVDTWGYSWRRVGLLALSNDFLLYDVWAIST